MIKESSAYAEMIKSKKYVPHNGQILYFVDGRYVCLTEDCSIMDEPVDLKAIDGSLLYSFNDDGEVMSISDIKTIMNAGF